MFYSMGHFSHVIDGGLWSTIFLKILITALPIFSFAAHALGGIAKNTCQIQDEEDGPLTFSSKSFIDFVLTFQSLIYFELIFGTM
jgi:hypothetical protein